MRILILVFLAFLGISVAKPGIPNFYPLDLTATTSHTFNSPTTSSLPAQTYTPSHITTATKTTSTVSTIIPSKTSVPDCNYQGLPSTRLLEHDMGGQPASTVLVCQTLCEAATGCESYQYRSTRNTYYDNCRMFNVKFNSKDDDGISLTILSHVSGMYYSNRWPSDGSGHCYG